MVAEDSFISIRLRLQARIIETFANHFRQAPVDQIRLPIQELVVPGDLVGGSERRAVSSVQVRDLLKCEIVQGKASSNIKWGLV
jgi:hypothetical protein